MIQIFWKKRNDQNFCKKNAIDFPQQVKLNYQFKKNVFKF